MESKKERVKKFSNIIYIILSIGFVACIIAGVFLLFIAILTLINPETTTFVIAGKEIELTTMFNIGNLSFNLPADWETDVNFLGLRFYPAVSFYGFLLAVVTTVGVWFTRDIFNKLRKDASPFRDDVVRALKKTAVAMFAIGIISGIVPLVAAGIIWVLALIFDYGAELQQQADETI